MGKIISPAGVPVLQQLAINHMQQPGNLAAPVAGAVPHAAGLLLVSVGGQTRVEAAAVAFLAGILGKTLVPRDQYERSQLIDDCIDIAEEFVAEIDKRAQAKQGATDAAG